MSDGPDQNETRTSKLHLPRIEGSPWRSLRRISEPSRFVDRATHPAVAGLNGQKSAAP
jgi:hypothetical protein